MDNKITNNLPVKLSSVTVAKYGYAAADVLSIICFWTYYNERTKNFNLYTDGHYWTYISLRKFATYMKGTCGRSTVFRAIKELEKDNIIIHRDGKDDNQKETRWYRVTEIGYKFLEHDMWWIKHDVDNYIAYKQKELLNDTVINELPDGTPII